jgi:hypothetical protein
MKPQHRALLAVGTDPARLLDSISLAATGSPSW